MTIRCFVQKIDVSEDTPDGFQPEGNVVDSAEITEEHYEMIEKDRNAVERGFDARWHEALMTLIQAIETIKDDYRQDAKETEDPDVEQSELGRSSSLGHILIFHSQILCPFLKEKPVPKLVLLSGQVRSIEKLILLLLVELFCEVLATSMTVA